MDLTPPKLRLPTAVRPTHYALELAIDPKADKAAGSIAIALHATAPAPVIWLHASHEDIAISRATLDGKPVTVTPAGTDLIGIVPAAPLAADARATLELAFTATIDHKRSRGIYAEAEGDRTYAYTFFEATDARRAFPCFDEPSAKVPWQLTFHVADDQVALANAPVVRETPEPDHKKRVELAESRPMPSYLVAFVVGPFDVVDDGVAGRAKTPIRFVVPKGRADELGYAKEVTPKVVAALEDYFDMDYPFGKLDVAVVPRYWGTMEHPGIVAMGQPLTLIRPDQATRGRKEHYANILAHELSHYWFGDLVTMAWWDDTWLNEALGEWSDMNITDAAEPSWHVRDDRVEFTAGGLAADETLAARAMRQPVETTEGIQASFDNDLVYFKGASVWRMFEAYVGADRWRDFIRGYLRAHAWGNASADDFLGAAGRAFGAPVEAAMRSFVEQPGAPRITFALTCTPDKRHATLALAQTRSLHAGDRDTQARTWGVPVCVRTSVGDRCTLLAKPAGELAFDGCPAWVVPNANANGYYRSTLDPALAAPVAATTVPERAIRYLDLATAVDRGELTIEARLAAVPGALADPSDKIVRAGVGLAAIDTRGLDDETTARARAFVQRALAPLAKQLGWARLAKDSDDRELLRAAVLGLVAPHDAQLGAQAKAHAAQWYKLHAGVPDDLVGPMLAAVAYRGDAADFDAMLAAAKQARDRTEQARLLVHLGGFIAPPLVARALAIVAGSELDIRDTLPIVLSEVGQRETRDAALAWLDTQLPALIARMRSDDAALFLGTLAGTACDEARVAHLAKLVAPFEKTVDGAANYVARGLEQSHQCIATTARQLPALQAFLAKQPEPTK